MDREIEENYDVENKKGIMYLFWFFFFHTYKMKGKQTGPEKGNAMQ